MIYVTGDIHGSHSISKLSSRHWAEGRSLTFGDYLIVCGDFGLWWDGESRGKHDIYWRNWLEMKHWTTLWVDGNHENHDMVLSLPVVEWNGGRAHVDERWPHIIHLMRGEVYDVPDGDSMTRIFSFGGARSHDIQWRTEGIDWWPREMPNLEEFENGMANLERVGWEVDYVITHDAPTAPKRKLLSTFPESWRTDRWEDDRLNGYLDRFDERLSYRKWYFGHYHDDAVVDEKHDVLYDQVLRIGENPEEGREWRWPRR